MDSNLEDENGGFPKFVVIILIRSLVKKYLEEGSEHWMLALDATYRLTWRSVPSSSSARLVLMESSMLLGLL